MADLVSFSSVQLVRNVVTLIVLWALAFATTKGVSTTVQVRSNHEHEASEARFELKVGQTEIAFDPKDRAQLLKLERQLEALLNSGTFDSSASIDENEQKRARRGLREIQRLARNLLESSEVSQQRRLRMLLLETVAAVNNLQRPPVPRTIDFFQTPWLFLKRLSRPVGKGRTMADNLVPGLGSDSSLRDPESSTFWRRPASIAGQDLYHGFGRTNLLLESDPLCTYAGPKESFGRNPGFTVECGGLKLKLKFAEISSEPFAVRIFDALGYHADITDYSPGVKVRYSRRLLQEFNSRKPLQTHFTFLRLVPLFTLNLQQSYDPCDFVAGAVLKNGTRCSGQELKRRLFRDPNRPHPERDAANFRPEFESNIAYLQTVPANVQLNSGKSIGPWDFGDLDHASKRELRGAGLLAAWLGWFDTRFDNTRLRLLRHKGQPELEHYFSDLGGVLGETTGLLYARGELPNAFPWTFTYASKTNQLCMDPAPIRLRGYKPIAATPAFAEMTCADARWMARLIGSLTEEQIKDALVASGFDSAGVRLYLAKLVNRRDQMILDLGLASEIPLCRPSGIDRRFSYDPAVQGKESVRCGDGVIQARSSGNRIIRGKLVETGSGPQLIAGPGRFQR